MKQSFFLTQMSAKALNKPLIIIEVPDSSPDEQPAKSAPSSLQSETPPAGANKRLGIVGSGGFVKNFILPNLKSIKTVDLAVLASSDTAGLVNLRDKYGIDEIVSNIDDALSLKTDAMIIANRHSDHFAFLKKSLEAGKHVFVEKPTVNKTTQLEALTELVKRNDLGSRIPPTQVITEFSAHMWVS